MDVILKAVSHAAMGDIPLKDNLLLIGRHEVPFFASASTDAAKLSRRHARIFQQDDTAYIVDLDSRNGTVVNGQPVGNQPIALKRGDEVCFAEIFSYRIEINDATTISAGNLHAARLRVVLEMQHRDQRRDFIALTQFPYLVSKVDPSIARYKDSYPSLLDKVSRRHAYIFIKDRSVYVEDLNSTNGTFVAGTKLDKTPRVLVDGDIVAFGTTDFQFIVHIEDDAVLDAEATIIREPSIAASLHGVKDGTIFVDSPTSFLEIFCDQEVGKQPAGEPAAGGAEGKSANPPPTAAGGLVAELLAFVGLAGNSAEAKKARRIVGSLAAALVVLISALWFYFGRENPVKALLAHGQHQEAARVAERLLAADPGNQELATLATEAVIKALVPEWLKAAGQSDFVLMRSLLETGRTDLTAHNKEAQRLLEVLSWIGETAEFFKRRNGALLPLTLFKDEEPIQTLVTRWDKEGNEIARIATLVTAKVPAFEPAYTEALSQIRQLRDAQSLYVQAMDKLKQRVKDHVKNGTLDDARSELDAFHNKYPKIAGVESLQTELREYASLSNLVKNQDIAGILRARKDSPFQSPLFKEAVDQVLAGKLPPPEVLSAYDRAAALWQNGQSDQAIATLAPLTKQAWGAVTSKRAEHYQRVATAYAELQRARGSAQYGETLLHFYGLLDSAEDGFYFKAIEQDFSKHKDRALETASGLAHGAQQDWSAYQKNDGISARVRVEKSVSEHFRGQAQRLTSAHRQISKSVATYELLRIELPEDVAAGRDAIAGEIQRQRRWLGDLKLVIDPALLAQKLELLPAL